eukprot:GDKH01007288.1.p1 GENE.GDKH01007288.1~~GDKH01007288.1.p1  ORF type:complete len:66 (+),score=4.65 GDKH01007288.1:1-198(+)
MGTGCGAWMDVRDACAKCAPRPMPQQRADRPSYFAAPQLDRAVSRDYTCDLYWMLLTSYAIYILS